MDVNEKVKKVRAEFEILQSRINDYRSKIAECQDRQKQLQGQYQLLVDVAKEEGVDLAEDEKVAEAPAEEVTGPGPEVSTEE